MLTYLREGVGFYRDTLTQVLGLYRGTRRKDRLTMTASTAPKPSPDLFPPRRETYRARALRHAADASQWLDVAAEALDRDREYKADMIDLARTAALVSLACSHVSPPARSRHKRTPWVSSVDDTAEGDA